jgi:hypothetical protein
MPRGGPIDIVAALGDMVAYNRGAWPDRAWAGRAERLGPG